MRVLNILCKSMIAEAAHIINTTFREGIINIGIIYAKKYRDDPVATIKLFKNSLIPVEIMANIYTYLLAHGEIEPIEKISQEERNYLAGISKKESKKFYIAIYTIKKLL